jgi:putative Mg2+ transporter-C (MgtC) family protein
VHAAAVCRFGTLGTVAEMLNIWSQLSVLALTALAVVLGGLIGWERRQADKPTGIRTCSIVSGASALIVALGAEIQNVVGMGDPTRALHAVITGIGFLGAGAIYIPAKNRPAGGMTTAATVFATAAIGVTVGLGAPISAIGVTALVLVVLRLFPQMERRTRGDHTEHPDHTD